MTVSFRALGTTATIAVTETDALGVACAAVERELDAIDRAASRFRDDSELSLLNRARGQVVDATPLFLEALHVAVDAARRSNGIVDPTVGRTLRLAGYDTTFTVVAARDGSTFRPRFAPTPGWEMIEIDDARATVRVPDGVEVDLGATAKALAADRAAAAAAQATGCGVLVSLGGDIATAGEAPADGWPVGIADDHAAAPGDVHTTVTVHAGGLATSSTTVRRWRSAGGDELHHVIDPRTGRPAVTPWRTVTVAAATCVDANVASTAALVLGEEAPSWLAAASLPARLVARTGEITAVCGWPAEVAVA